MKRILIFVASIVLSFSTVAQVAYLQYRVVPQDKEAEFVEKETKYWSKVAQAAANQGHLAGWSLWKKVGVTKIDAPNYVFVNNYESLDKMDPSKVWSEDNLKTMGKDPEEGVIDKDNRVFGYQNMLICDGSMISSNPGVNPSLTITALSERAMSKIPEKTDPMKRKA